MTRSADEHEFRTQVARRVHMRRIWLRLSQQEVADRAGLTRNFVSSIERGAQAVDAGRLKHGAAARDGTLDWLLTGPDEHLTTATPGRPDRTG